jgi:tRNA nucleotidyltransferase (CCA-adding enzyme)
MKIYKKYLHKQNNFAQNLYERLVENFPQTYFVGGSVRDALLHKTSCDIDIATSATPEQVVSFLNREQINFSDSGIRYGVIKVLNNKLNIEIATFRLEKYGQSRYPAIEYVKNLRLDAKRRDFTINCLYLQAKTGQLRDYYGGVSDLKKREIKLIGDVKHKIAEDPLRIVRALRFCLQLNFKMSKKTWLVVMKNFDLVKKLTKKKIAEEIVKVGNQEKIKVLNEMFFGEKPLDKVSKKFYYDFK